MNPWGLLALASLPAILVIHLFRHRFQPHRVAGLFLWAAPGRDPTSGRRLHRLESTLSLVLELLLALSISFYLMDVRWNGRPGVDHRVIVLDSSASMGARLQGRDVAARARETVRALIGEAGRQGQVSLVASGGEPSLLAGPAALVPEALSALERWDPAARGHDLMPALDLARELAGPDGLVHIVSDRLPEAFPEGERIAWRAVGVPLPNAALLAARRERTEDPEVDRIFLRIGCYGRVAPAGVLTVAVGDEAPAEHRLSLEPGVERRLAFDVRAGERPVTVALPEDALAIDNRAVLPRPTRAPVACANLLPAGEARRAVEAALRAVPGTEIVASEGEAHLTFASPDRTPAGLPETWWCRIGPLPGRPPDGTAARSFLGPFLMEKAHPLLADVHLGGVVWAGADPAGAPLHPLVSSGNRILAGLVPETEGVSLVLNLDFGKSTLHRSPDWPILVGNLVRMRRDALPGVLAAAVRAGETLAVNLPRDAEGPVRWIGPSGERREVPGRGRVVLAGLERPGIHRLLAGDRELGSFAVNFQDPGESDLRSCDSGERGPADAPGSAPAEALVDPRSHVPLLFLALALFLVNAFVGEGLIGKARREQS